MRLRGIAKGATLIGLLTFVSIANAENPFDHKRNDYLYTFGGRSVLILGSEDMRQVLGIGYSSEHDWSRLRFRRSPGMLVSELYADYSKSMQHHHRSLESYSVGGLLMGRWPLFGSQSHFFGEFGWGLQLANRKTRDLDTTLNSTPVFGLGLKGSVAGRECYGELRYLHISNANADTPNNGQNQILFVLGFKM